MCVWTQDSSEYLIIMFLAGAEAGLWTRMAVTLLKRKCANDDVDGVCAALRAHSHTHTHTFAGHTFLWPNKNVPSKKRER